MSGRLLAQGIPQSWLHTVPNLSPNFIPSYYFNKAALCIITLCSWASHSWLPLSSPCYIQGVSQRSRLPSSHSATSSQEHSGKRILGQVSFTTCIHLGCWGNFWFLLSPFQKIIWEWGQQICTWVHTQGSFSVAFFKFKKFLKFKTHWLGFWALEDEKPSLGYQMTGSSLVSLRCYQGNC